MRICPKCGYVDPPEWRPKSWHTHSEIEICRYSDLELIDADLAEQISDGSTFLDQYNAYKRSKTGIWVYRRPRFIYDVQKWKDIPAETPKRVDPSQKKLIENMEPR